MENIVIEKYSARTGLKLRPGETEEEQPTAAPENTSKMDPMSILVALMGDPSGGIERMEREGQRELTGTSTIPTHFLDYSAAEGKALLCRAGFEVGKVVPGDDLFQYCRLPEGWKKVTGHHAMWTQIVDAKGRERGSIFYKAAFYDRSAHIRLHNRITLRQDYAAKGMYRYQVVAREDGENVRVLYSAERDGIPDLLEIPYEERAPYWKMEEEIRADARQWMENNYPEHEDELAYWDEDFT